jgi:hypothetical protein
MLPARLASPRAHLRLLGLLLLLLVLRPLIAKHGRLESLRYHHQTSLDVKATKITVRLVSLNQQKDFYV